MFADLSIEKLLVLALVGLFVLGPERLPAAVTWLARTTRRVRAFADDASRNLQRELGSEVDQLRAPLQELREPLRQLHDLRRPASSLGRYLSSPASPVVPEPLPSPSTPTSRPDRGSHPRSEREDPHAAGGQRRIRRGPGADRPRRHLTPAALEPPARAGELRWACVSAPCSAMLEGFADRVQRFPPVLMGQHPAHAEHQHHRPLQGADQRQEAQPDPEPHLVAPDRHPHPAQPRHRDRGAVGALGGPYRGPPAPGPPPLRRSGRTER